MSDNDLFDCFGSDSESDNSETSPHTSSATATTIPSTATTTTPVTQSLVDENHSNTRDKSCGVLAFHPNTEQSLLLHVRNSILHFNRNLHHDRSKNSSSSAPSTTPPLCPWERVLYEIDWYCLHRHWMMCIGPVKGIIVADALESAIQSHLITKNQHGRRRKDAATRFIAVELGTYCGYGSIFLSKVWKKRFPSTTTTTTTTTTTACPTNVKFQLFTVEINPQYAKIAREMMELAQVQDIVTVVENDLLMDGSTANVGELIKTCLSKDQSDAAAAAATSDKERQEEYIHFLMIDHDKDSYLKDLQILEKTGLIRSGTVVVADNVIFAGIDEYIDYMHDLAKRGIVNTCIKEATVEYCSPDVVKKDNDHTNGGVGGRFNFEVFKDGVEITEYLQDPV